MPTIASWLALGDAGRPIRATGRIPDCATGVASTGQDGEMRMTAMDVVGVLLLVFLVAPMVTARPSRF